MTTYSDGRPVATPAKGDGMTCHRNGEVTVWLTYEQVWMRLPAWELSDTEIACMSPSDTARYAGHIIRHLADGAAGKGRQSAMLAWAKGVMQ